MSDLENRFGGIARLFGKSGLQRLAESHVAVIGLGGVGSWTVEALARSGIGTLTLVDMDDVCVSNINRQLPAVEDAIGKPKAAVLAERVLNINPGCAVHPHIDFFTEKTCDNILSAGFHYVVDAIDTLSNKCLLIAACRERKIPIVVSGSGGGRRDATQTRMADLSQASHDRLLAKVRKKLRGEFGFPSERDLPFNIPCVYSPEPPVFPRQDGSICDVAEEGVETRLTCEFGYGSATFVTGAFGFAAAGKVVADLVRWGEEAGVGAGKA